MNTEPIEVISSRPPVTFDALRAGYRRACGERAARPVIEKPKPTPAEVAMRAALDQVGRMTRDKPFNGAQRTLNRMNARMAAMKYPREQRKAAELLLRIINRP